MAGAGIFVFPRIARAFARAACALATMWVASVSVFSSDVPESVSTHPQWAGVQAEGVDASQSLDQFLARGGAVGDLLLFLDLLEEARSIIADGDRAPALSVYLGLPQRAAKPLRKWIEARQADVERARAGDDVDIDELLQLQTRISVVVSELAGRREALLDPSRRRGALRDLKKLWRFADAALWERHALNWRLRGPLRLGSGRADAAIDRFYRRNDSETFRSSDRAAYVKLLARIEGKGFDAINGYDHGGVSIGIAQFSASGPYLGRLLRRLDEQRPKLYRRHVSSRGLTIDADGWLSLDGRPLLAAIRGMRDQNEFHPVLLALVDCFEVRRLRRSLNRLQTVVVDRMLDEAMRLDGDDGGLLSDVLSSSRGLAHLADAFVNTGGVRTLKTFREAQSQANMPAVDAFVEARRGFYRRTGQAYLLQRVAAIEEAFPREAP